MGNWRNYDELEENLSLEELITTVNAYREKQKEEHKFMAALKGIDLEKESGGVNITDVSPVVTAEQGFGVGRGLSHKVQEISNIVDEVL